MKEFTVRLANRPGMLAALTKRLDDAGVHIEALAAFGLDQEGYVRLIVDDAVRARRALHTAGLAAEERTVLTSVLPDRPGALAGLTGRLANAGVNIDAIYLLNSTVNGLEFAIAVNDIEAAQAGLEEG